ncbi:MAG: hypothetical protein L3J49_04875 [Desulfobulbaceae bacterium]|nr:hypothetical protein [Desulfobulbaceae bacterium]
MTEAEGQLILNGLQEQAQLDWLSQRLQLKGPTGRPVMTTNEWARDCLEGREIRAQESDQILAPCPFLDQNQSCSMYSLRPFSCRCFGSSVDCVRTGMAEQPDILMEVNTVTLQIIEHLGQGNCWGNMLDVLPMMIRKNESRQENKNRGELRPEKTGQYLRQAKPLPGFLVMPDQQAEIQDYLTGLFAVQIDSSNLGTILQINL